jgi:kynureninase
MFTRREFLGRTGRAAPAAMLASYRPDGLARLFDATAGVGARQAADVARDETYWREVQQAFTLDRTIVNLNNGGVCPSPRVVHEALKRYLDISNQVPPYHMWQVLEPNIESVRRTLAADVGVDPETIAITRNASEALQIAQLGLDLQAGDEVLTTNQDYGRMLNTWEQRVRRDGIVLTKIAFPVPPDQADLVHRFADAITPATKVIHFCHITNLTGHIFPVRDICALARERGIVTVVDGAHAYAHFPFTLEDFDCDYYGTSRSARASCTSGPNASPGTGRCSRRRLASRATSGSSRRSARTRPRITTRSPRPWRFTTASASSGRRRACGT